MEIEREQRQFTRRKVVKAGALCLVANAAGRSQLSAEVVKAEGVATDKVAANPNVTPMAQDYVIVEQTPDVNSHYIHDPGMTRLDNGHLIVYLHHHPHQHPSDMSSTKTTTLTVAAVLALAAIPFSQQVAEARRMEANIEEKAPLGISNTNARIRSSSRMTAGMRSARTPSSLLASLNAPKSSRDILRDLCSFDSITSEFAR